MISKRSAKCASCKHLWDAAMLSSFPISCYKNGEKAPFSDDLCSDIKQRDFVDDNGHERILKDAGCPNFETRVDFGHLVLQREDLIAEYTSWPVRVNV